jgi:hypothetical protein
VRHTRAGWTGVDEKGERVNITYRQESGFGPARIPPKDYIIMRGAAGGAPEGVVLIERARTKSKRTPPRGRR